MNVKGNEHKALLNGCYRTEIAVHPSNWKTQKASVAKKGKPVEWYVWYRFFDPSFKEQFPFGKLLKRRGMNKYSDLASRQVATEEIIAIEKDNIDLQNFNPISELYMQPPVPDPEVTDDRPVSSNTPLIAALEWGRDNMKREQSTLDIIKVYLNAFKTGAEALGLDKKPIGQVEKKDITLIFIKVGKIKNEKYQADAKEKGLDQPKTWSAHSFNAMKSHLSMVFTWLDQFQVYQVNPIEGIRPQKRTRKKRETLTDEEFMRIDASVRAHDPFFWRFIHIFQESGCRRGELLGVQLKDVNLSKRRFKALVKKDTEYKEVWKEIDAKVLPLWVEVIREARELSRGYTSTDLPLFLFGEGLQPMVRDTPIRPEQVTRRWRLQIKKKLDISADLYSLKHRRTTRDIDRFVDETIQKARKKAAKKNSHTTTSMVERVYDVHTERRAAIIRKIKGRRKPKRKAIVLRTLRDKTA